LPDLLPIIVTAVATALICVLIAIFNRARGTPYLKLELDVLPKIGEALPTLAGLTESTVYEGNKATLELTGKLADGRASSGKATLVKEGGDWKLDEDGWATPTQ